MLPAALSWCDSPSGSTTSRFFTHWCARSAFSQSLKLVPSGGANCRTTGVTAAAARSKRGVAAATTAARAWRHTVTSSRSLPA